MAGEGNAEAFSTRAMCGPSVTNSSVLVILPQELETSDLASFDVKLHAGYWPKGVRTPNYQIEP